MDSQAPKESISPLQSLPQEILSSVCSYLPQGALYQLTLVNKNIGQRVVPALYSSFSQNGGDSMQVRQYFRTAVREPELAEHLREVTIQGSIEITHKQMRKCLQKLDKDTWARRLHEQHPRLAYDYFSYGPDLAIALLLSLEPKIHSIRALHPPNPIKKGNSFKLPIYLEPIRGILAAGSPLPQWTNYLSTLEITLRTTSWQCIAPLFQLPVLKTLILSGGGGFHMATENMEAAIHSSPIEVLDFEKCAVPLTTIAQAVSACKSLRVLRHSDCDHWAAPHHLHLLQQLHEHASTLRTLKTCCWHAPKSTSTDNGILASFIALIELEVHYSHAADDLLPPNLCRLVICATTRDRVCIMEDMETLAQKLSKRSNIDVTLKYRHYRKPNYELPKLRELPSVFAKSDLNLSLYVYPVVGSSWYLIAKFDHRAAWLSQRPSETGAKELRAWSKRLDSTYDYREIVLAEIKNMVGKHENHWKSKDYDLDFMLPYLFRNLYKV
ncbi:uncharacterized protein J4E87_002008 [Alternaria ethzedia]|uniref:uncharacterized protein n=1 Tax=Alternaria ethzedia TaxID=181014 RepID=UPI0020C1FDA0|nr:uncharacterized protein J4E87_002008 [Alternaria ethzedia]KAI4632535.1 hypothetical protein J4E87_002008 [Alternaria ethzedia]